MIKFNDFTIKQERFGDGTLKCQIPPINSFHSQMSVPQSILWCYDDDSEIFTLVSLCDYLRNHFPQMQIRLILPYIPNARQDREVSDRLFTLKTFAQIINSLHFTSVEVYDPHSDVACALLDRVVCYYETFSVSYNGAAVMYPDAGAAKKYSHFEHTFNPIIGNKHRNADGRIDSYELLNFQDGVKTVFIRDDICSYGGTFVAAAKALRERGVETIHLIVTHCENNILKGEVFKYIDKVWTTDSIFTESHPKVFIAKSFRGGTEQCSK